MKSSNIQNKKIIIAVTGSIAAYKIATLTRLFVKAGAEVQILMTPTATTFISPLTLATLSKKKVLTEIISEENWNNHVELGLWADVMLVAPATATTLAKMAQGLCDTIVTAVYLSARCPIFFAPAMDLDMWHHPATQRNIKMLLQDGCQLIPVGTGELASGLVGDGRMAEPEEIFSVIDNFFTAKQDLIGKKILVTAGPTYEALDPVRFIGNRSSGKMGYAIAEALANRGAEVILVSGPTKISVTHKNINLMRVESAQEMYDAALENFETCNAAVLAAAVADYRPAHISDTKIKKSGDNLTLELEKTPDIAKSLGERKTTAQIIVGFALETDLEIEHATAKRRKKNFDFIVLNSLRDIGAGFNHDTNKVSFIFADDSVKNFELKSKMEVANDIVNEIVVLTSLRF